MFEGTRGVGAAVPFPAGPVRIRLGIKGWKFLTQARIPQSPGCSGRALGCPHPLAQAQGKERSPGPGPAALFEVTTPSDPWKSWRGSKLQPCCPARPRCAHPQLSSTSILPFFPVSNTQSHFPVAPLLGSSSKSRNSCSARVTVRL